MTTKQIRYFLYARKSSENEDKQVASIPSQIEELKKLAKKHNLRIAAILTEEKSAKAPGRTVFTKMIQDIHNGKAEGIICWKLDRLARNPIDGGTISWMLQQSLIQHIQTFQRSYYPSDNVLMMNLEFGMANQFILDLSVNTKRGQRNKIENGWYPHKPPIGYLNNKYNLPDKPPIFEDPDRFKLVKKLWSILLEKKCSLKVLYETALNMGLTSTKNTLFSYSKFCTLFTNPFYYGYFAWNGQLYSGKHKPMISKSDFDLAQRILGGRSNHWKTEHIFAFTGLIRCNECGASITAEAKTKHQKNGNTHHYIYYRCTRRIKPNCSNPPIRANELETQILNVLGKLSIPPSFHQWAIKQLKEEQSKEITDRNEISNAQRKCLDNCAKRLDRLLNMRLNGEITSEEFNAKKEELLKEKQKYEALLKDNSHRQESWLDNAENLFSFAETAKKRFETGTLQDKREILACLGSNLLLTNKKLEVSLENGLGLFLDVAPEVQALHNRLEPLQPIENTSSWDKIYSQNQKWGG